MLCAPPKRLLRVKPGISRNILRQLWTAISIIVLCSIILAPANAITVGPNVDITASNDSGRQQVEPTIAVHPLKPNIIVAGAQDLRLRDLGFNRWHGYYRSTDGGQTWSVSLLPGFPGDSSPQGLASPLHRFRRTTDPVLGFDRNGNVYYAGIAISPGLRLFVAKYVNDGADYAGAVLLGSADFEKIAVDTSGGPHDGTVYVSFFDNVIRSTDGGQTFSDPVSPFPENVAGGVDGMAVDIEGTLYVVSLGIGDSILVTKSTDGGVSFGPFHHAVNRVTLLPDFLPDNGFRTITAPQIAANDEAVFVVWNDFGTGDADILSVASANGGTSWSQPVRVNDVATGQQFFPTISISGRTVVVAWYDGRLDDGGTIQNLDVFYAQARTDEAVFSANLRVTEVSFDPNLVLRTDFPNNNEPFIGDYISISTGPTSAYPIWADNRNACSRIDPTFGCVDQDIFTSTITF